MRYLGNKDSIVEILSKIIKEKTALSNNTIFFDAFCGTGSVANSLKQDCRIVLNDNLHCSAIYSHGKLIASNCTFERLCFNPIDYLNNNNNSEKGYFYKNYSLGGSSRMYFSEENAARIDYFRNQIEEWFSAEKISKNEYHYLLACLIESVSFVANTAGVYGAFLKKWDSRALKKITFLDISDGKKTISDVLVYMDKIENIISNIDCDILYLDPPYTQNQYGTQYHLLETLILNDKPNSISKITGSRSTKEMRSDWSKIYKVHILLDRIIAETKASHIFMSYNNSGDMSKEYIEAIMKRYGYEDTFECISIPYKKYENWKSQNKNTHFEYLFYIKKKPKSEIIFESPLNYIGSKAKIVLPIRQNAKNCKNFIDVFGGGFNVGINSDADCIIYNDINFIVKDLIKSFKEIDTYDYILYVKRFIDKFHLEKGNKENYLIARNYYNSLPNDKKDSRMLFALILYSFQQQIRFNSNYEFNNPVGVRWFNDCILAKLVSFSRVIKLKNVKFYSTDFLNLSSFIEYTLDSFLYLDPPYKLTTGSYNDGKRGFSGWNNRLENELFNFIDSMTKKNIPCMLSYVLEHKGVVNSELAEWIDKNNYTFISLGDVVGISGQKRKEVLILNYAI